MRHFEVNEMESRLEMAKWYGSISANQNLKDGTKTYVEVSARVVF